MGISEWKSRKIVQTLKKKYKKEKRNETVHDKRFHATKVNALWHTDIHYLKNKPHILITLIIFWRLLMIIVGK